MTKTKKLLVGSVLLLVGALVTLLAVTYSWYTSQRQLNTATWIKTPIVLTIGSGNNHSIQYLDMGDIDVETATYKDYVICVYGMPVDNYSLQLAYTTNIAFHYEVYRAKESNTNSGAASTYVDANGITQTEYFEIANKTPVISGKTLAELGSDAGSHQSHDLSYGDENGENSISADLVQSNAEPLYWLAEEEGANVLRPENTLQNGEAFLDYFIIRVSWEQGQVTNDKETDIVYLTASR